MKIFPSILFLLGLAHGAVAQHSAEPFSISISADEPTVKLGDPVHIKIELTNLSDHDIDCTGVASNGLDKAYTYSVEGPNGRPLEKKKRAHPQIGETFSTWPCTVTPGKTASAAGGLISQFYPFTQVGQYTVVVSRKIENSSKPGVVSNSLTIQVAE